MDGPGDPFANGMTARTPTHLGDVLDRAKDELMARWRRRGARDRGQEPVLAEYLPELLERLIQSLLLFEEGADDDDDGEPTGVRRSPALAARVADGATHARALGELSLFRSLVDDLWEEAGARPGRGATRLLHATVDRAAVEIAELIARRDREALIASYDEERYKLALHASKIGTWDYDPRSGNIRWDARCREICGVGPDVPVTYTTFLGGIHAEDRPHVEELVARALDPSSGGDYRVEYRVIRADGETRWVAIRGRVIFDAAGAPVRFIGASVDITEPRLESEFRERFVGILGHDLRQPLSVIRFGAEMLAKQPNLSPRDVSVLERIGRAGERMTRMIGDLLDFARGRQAGGIPVDRRPEDLFGVVRHLVSELESVHPDRTFRLSVSGDGTGEWDRDRMAQTIGNLLGNALTHGAPDAPIEVVLDADAERLRVEVKNQGPPIPEAAMGSLFDPYRRGREKRAEAKPSGGVGLGLYIAREIIAAHGGRIEVESTADAGTTFRVLLPRAQGA